MTEQRTTGSRTRAALARGWRWFWHLRWRVKVPVMVVAAIVVVIAAASGGESTDTPTSNIQAEVASPTATATTPGATPTPRPRGFVTRADYNEDWPFTVDEGLLQCQNVGGNLNAITLKVGDATYGINGIARAPERLKTNGWRDGNDIRAASGDVTRLIADGQKLC